MTKINIRRLRLWKIFFSYIDHCFDYSSKSLTIFLHRNWMILCRNNNVFSVINWLTVFPLIRIADSIFVLIDKSKLINFPLIQKKTIASTQVMSQKDAYWRKCNRSESSTFNEAGIHVCISSYNSSHKP